VQLAAAPRQRLTNDSDDGSVQVSAVSARYRLPWLAPPGEACRQVMAVPPGSTLLLACTPAPPRQLPPPFSAPACAQENLLTLISSKRVLYIMLPSSGFVPLELAFQQHYGPLQCHLWFGHGLLLLGFLGGQVVMICPSR